MEGLKPKVIITYQDKNVTSDFAPVLKSVSFRDYLEGRASEIEIVLSNEKGFFFGDWYPAIDDKITVKMGYENADLTDCGTFWVDEVKLSGSRGGDECNIRALSVRSSALHAPVKKQNHYRIPIRDFAGKLAAELGLKATGDLDGMWSGIQEESDMKLMYRIARETGCVLRIEGNLLVFYKISNIRKQGDEPQKVLEIPRGNVLSYDISDKAEGRITRCTVKWWDAKTKKAVSGNYDAGLKGGGSVTVWEEVKDETEARKKAQDYITDRNKKGEEFTMSLMGDVRLRAGICVQPSGYGRFDKVYYIAEAKHLISNTGYSTQITLRK